MSIANLFFPNIFDLFCDTLTANVLNILNLNVTTINTTNLNATTITATTLTATTETIGTSNINSLNVNSMIANVITSTSLSSSTITSTTLSSGSIITTSVNTNNLVLSSGTPLTNYFEQVISGTLTGPWAITPTCNLKFSILNNKVTICQSSVITALQNGTSTFMTFSTAIPITYLPANPAIIRFPIWVFDAGNGGTLLGTMTITPSSGIINFYSGPNNNFSGTLANSAGFTPFGVTYDISF